MNSVLSASPQVLCFDDEKLYVKDLIVTIDGTAVQVLQESQSPEEVAHQIARNKVDDSPFFVINLSEVLYRFRLWNQLLPTVTPFYAIKCNDDAILTKVLAKLGCGFDVASRAEIQQALSLTESSMLVYANPCKSKSFITFAKNNHINLMTFDTMEEMIKIKSLHPNARLLLRINVGDPSAQAPLNMKFGCEPDQEGRFLLKAAADKYVDVVGICFHVGSGCKNPEVYTLAINYSKVLFVFGTSLGLNMHILDIGGGFPGTSQSKSVFEGFARIINCALHKYFPPPCNVTVIAEPGRFFACAPFSLSANIVAAKKVWDGKSNGIDAYEYFINDGIYGSFCCILSDHYDPKGNPLEEDQPNDPKYLSTIWGPTCDGLDKIETSRYFRKMNAGDWLFYKDMGAYTCAAATVFNGFEKPVRYYYVQKDDLKEFLSIMADN